MLYMYSSSPTTPIGSIMHVRPGSVQVSAEKDLSDRAQAAVKAFRSMQHGLSSYARALTGNKSVRVEIASGAPRTDGTTIWYQPPIALGDRTPHDRFLCSKRDTDGLQACAACRIREEVLVNIYHEIAHIAENTFAKTTEKNKEEALKLAVAEWGGEFEERIKARMRDQFTSGSFLGLANVISPFLPSIVNSLEDARVDLAMFNRRKGTRKMLVADTFNMLKNGIPDAQFNLQMWNEAPLNSQVSIGLYMEAAVYPDWQQYFHPAIGDTIADSQLQKLIQEVRVSPDAEATYTLAVPVLARLRELGYYKMPEEEDTDDAGTPSPSPEGDDDESDEADQGEGGSDASDSGSGEADGSGDDSDATGGDGSDSDPSSPGGTDEDAGDQGGIPDQQDGDEERPEADQDGAGEADGAGTPEEGSDGDAERGGSPTEGDRGDEREPGGDEGSSGREGLEAQDERPADVSGPVQEGEEESVDADSDGLPEESGRDGRGEASGGDAESDSGPEEGSEDNRSDDGSADSSGKPADEDGSDHPGRSDQHDADDLGEGDGDDAGEHDAGEESGDHQSDDDGGQPGERGGDGGTQAQQVPSDRPDGVTDEPQGHGDDPEPEPEAGSEPQGSGPDLIDSGADQGLGGIDLSHMPMGSPEDVAAATGHLHDKIEEKAADLSGDMTERDAIKTAVIQGTYFETPSVGVSEVVEHKYAPGETGWGPETDYLTDNEKDALKSLGVICDMDIPESALGPALLKTRRVFDDNDTAAYNSNMRRGNVNTKVLGRRAWSGDDRLFGKKRLPDKKDYAVIIGVDISTSNWGTNLALVKRAVFAQAELLHRVGIKFRIVAHSASSAGGNLRSRTYAMHLHQIKDWNQPWDDSTKDAVRNLAAHGGNVDGHAMEYMRKELGKVTATDKILLYYTDGKFPAANKEEELVVLQRQLQLCKRDRITLLGVGIQTDSPVRHGLDTVQVDGDEDLKRVVEHLGKRLQRSAR